MYTRFGMEFISGVEIIIHIKSLQGNLHWMYRRMLSDRTRLERMDGLEMNNQLNGERNETTKNKILAYFSLRFDSLLAFGRWRLFFSPTTASLLDVSDVGVSSDSTCSKLIFLSGDCLDLSTTSWGLSTGVVMIEWSLLIIIVSSFSMAAALSRSVPLLDQCFIIFIKMNFQQNKNNFFFIVRLRREILSISYKGDWGWDLHKIYVLYVGE